MPNLGPSKVLIIMQGKSHPETVLEYDSVRTDLGQPMLCAQQESD